MKNALVLFLTFIIISSCNTDDDANGPISIFGKWNLTKIYSNSVGGAVTPTADETQFYQIRNDGTFEHISIENEVSVRRNGTYIVTEENPNYGNEDNAIKKFVELSYASDDTTFFNCGIIEDDMQLLILNSENKLQNTLGGICDGNTYEYTKE